MKKAKTLVCTLLVFALLLLAACTGNPDSSTPPPEGTSQEPAGGSEDSQDELVYSFLDLINETAMFNHDNPNDIVTPYIEQKFNIKVGDIMFRGSVTTVERLTMMIAAGTVPDVVRVPNTDVNAFYQTGVFADLTPYRDKLKNIEPFVSDAGWDRLTVNGQLAAIPANMSGGEINVDNPQVAELLENDPRYKRTNNWAFVANEDILRQAGYTFKSIADLQAELDASPRPINDADVSISPAIETIDDFEAMLVKIKNLNLTVDGKPMIPLSIPEWAIYHIATLVSPTGGWYCDPATMAVSGFVYNPQMKEFYQRLKKWYDEGLIDQDYLIQKSEQYDEKVASGRVALSLPSYADPNAVRENLKAQGSDLKVIPWPGDTEGRAVDPSFPCGYENIMINKDAKDIGRLLEYFDWFNSDEGKDVICWGPESAGLWEMKDGVKQMKDEELATAILANETTGDGRGAEYYGLTTQDVTGSSSKAVLCAVSPLYCNQFISYSYPIKLDAWQYSFSYVSTEMLCRDGKVLSAVGEASSAASDYYWSVIHTTKVAELLSAASDEDFDAVWDSMLEDYKVNGNYDAGVAEMEEAYQKIFG